MSVMILGPDRTNSCYTKTKLDLEWTSETRSLGDTGLGGFTIAIREVLEGCVVKQFLLPLKNNFSLLQHYLDEASLTASRV